MFFDCYNQYLPTLFETHFLNTSNCCSYQLYFCEQKSWGLWIWEVIKLDGKSPQRDWNKLTVSALPAQVTHCPPVCCCLFFCVIPLSTLSFVCSHVMYYCKSGTWPQVCVFATLSFCRTVSVCLDIISLTFLIVTVCLEMCATVFLRSPRDVCVWGNGKKHSACAYWLGLLIVIYPTLVKGVVAQ